MTNVMKHENPTDNQTVGMAEVEQVLSKVAEDNPLKPIVTGLIDKLEEQEDRIERVELSRDAAHRRIDQLEEQIEAGATGSSGDNPKGSGGENGSPSGDLLPIERLAEAENRQDATMGHVTESVERAVTLFKHYGDWSKKTPKGRTITANLRDLLSAATGERLAWRQVYRVMDKIEEWSKGMIEHKETRRHGHILVMSEGRSSSAVGG